MILINLLPHREVARKRQRERFFLHLALAGLAGLAVIAVWFAYLQQQISSQQARNDFLTLEIQQLDAQIKEIASLRDNLALLKSRQQAVEGLQGNRNLPVHVFDTLAAEVPEGVHLVSLKQEGGSLVLGGVSLSQERISEFMRRFNGGRWLSQPELVEIVASSTSATDRDQRRLFNFSLRVALNAVDGVAQPSKEPTKSVAKASSTGG